jgi:ATP-dependent RNA helicase DeaD
MSSSFAELGLSPELLTAINELEYAAPTPIQEQAIPSLLTGQNVVGQAQTGTGKTAAFILPLLQLLNKPADTVRALILVPTRELALQVTDAARWLAAHTQLRITSVYGGQSYTIQIRALKKGTDIVVGTPGRLMDLMRQDILNLSAVEHVILDEADEMLDMGFSEDVDTILSAIPVERQIALFSATFPRAVQALVNAHVPNPDHIRINPSAVTVSDTEQRYVYLREENKLAALIRLLEVEGIQSALIFTRTKVRAQEISDALNTHGIPAESLHGDLNQARRETVLRRLRSREITILVATDVAARGLDIDDLSHVINFDMPQDPEDYVHRIGRTGRAGKKGVALTFVTGKEKHRLRMVENFTKKALNEVPIPSIAEIRAHRDQKYLDRLMQVLTGENISSEMATVKNLSAQYSMETIAAAAIKLSRESEPELPHEQFAEPARPAFHVIEEPQKAHGKYKSENAAMKGGKYRGDKKQAPRYAGSPPSEHGHEDMVRLRCNLGHRHGIRPGDIVGAIASEVGIPGKSIGEIKIQDDYSFVDVDRKHASKVLRQSSGKYAVRGKTVILTKDSK